MSNSCAKSRENKDVSKNNNQVKKAAWHDILESFNQLNEVKRDLPQLMNQWINTKNSVKKRDFEYRRNCNATGGGPRPASPPQEDVEIMAMIPKEFEVDDNQYDCDSLDIKKDLVEITVPGIAASLPKIVFETVSVPEIIVPVTAASQPEIVTETVSVSEQSSQKVKESKSKQKINKKRIATGQEQEIFLLAKKERERKMLFQKQEHERRLEILETEHQMRLEIMKKEMEYWEKRNKQLN